MKNLIQIILFTGILIFISCEDYLERTPASDITDEKVFGTYHSFQGFVDMLYYDGLTPYMWLFTSTIDCGDDVLGNKPGQQASGAFTLGNYNFVWSNTRNPFNGDPKAGYISQGFWTGGWLTIHRANLGLANIDKLITATNEERNLLLGQMYFFRAWCHFEIARAWGGIPYVDELLNPEDNMKLPRLSLEETFVKIGKDFEKAARLLPWSWDETNQGSNAPGKNWGRITRGIALAMKARAYLYGASPWFAGLSSGVENKYNLALCDSAATAALEVINSNRYSLMPWNQYHYNFARNDNVGNNFISTNEIIFSRIQTESKGIDWINKYLGRIHLSKRTVGGTSANGVVNSPTLNFVNLYETANGLAINDDPTYDPNNPWVNRDPRFLKTILIDGVKWSSAAKPMIIELFSEGGSGNGAGLDMTPNSGGSLSGFLIRKYTCFGVNGQDKNWNNLRCGVPYIRLPEMYLTYAEAVNEMSGPNGTLQGSSLSAVEAVNIVRRRVKLPTNENITLPFELQTYGNISLPDVNSIYTQSVDAFRERIHNERSIELAFEGHRWYDIRRWYVAHKPEYSQALGLAFSKKHTSFRSFVMQNRIFINPKHYLLPFRQSDTYLYQGFEQNPGWE
ncbi:MAG: RagB/SusD family nutrient uptake outer membrane protein [Proteiniphilum sp.]